MNAHSTMDPIQVDVRDLNSVRRAARAAGEEVRVILGDDWVDSGETSAPRARKGWFTLHRSPLTRKIILFNLIAMTIMAAAMLWDSPSREQLLSDRSVELVSEAELIAAMVEARMQAAASVGGAPISLDGVALRSGARAFVIAPDGTLVASAVREPLATPAVDDQGLLTPILNGLWDMVAGRIGRPDSVAVDASGEAGLAAARDLAARATEGPVVEAARDPDGRAVLTAAVPVMAGPGVDHVVAVRSGRGEVDAIVARERERVLRIFVIGILVSTGLSLVLASTIANPIADLAAAAEAGRDRNARAMSPGRVRIPDLTGRPDEIGRLSAAMRDMVAALYDRIEQNEQFAADVAHEIKNPLASLRSAVGTMYVAKRDDQRTKLLEIIEHDVRRLNRLVSDISSASRLDSELVKEEEKPVDLCRLLAQLSEHLSREARDKGIDYITDLPSQTIVIQGLEGRLAQVFVNLISNAISFCEDGDAIRVWTRRRENRVLVVVEDTGPGIPENALTKIFQRFYSERPEGQFGNNSGLGLAISKQIIEAHGGVIWAENIRPTDADASSQPLGARFVVGLPV